MNVLDVRPASPLLLDRTRSDAAVRVGAAALLASALGLVTTWWIADGGASASVAGGAALTSAGRLTGLLAGVLLLAQVVLMARVPVLERAVGQDSLARVHRLVGFTSFNLMLAHIGLVTLGYAAGTVGAGPGTFWELTVDYPGMLLAVAGTLCLVMVVVTSVTAARAGCATSPGTCCTSTPTSGSGSRCRTSCGPGSSSLARRAARCSGGPPGRPPRARSGLADRPAGVPHPAARPPRDLRRPREHPTWCRSTSPGGTWAPAGRGRPVPQLAVPRRAGLVTGPPVLPVGGS